MGPLAVVRVCPQLEDTDFQSQRIHVRHEKGTKQRVVRIGDGAAGAVHAIHFTNIEGSTSLTLPLGNAKPREARRSSKD